MPQCIRRAVIAIIHYSLTIRHSPKRQNLYTVSQKSIIFWIGPISAKINRFWWLLVCEKPWKFNIKSLCICPPYLSAVATLPSEIQVIFNNTTNTYFWLCALSHQDYAPAHLARDTVELLRRVTLTCSSSVLTCDQRPHNRPDLHPR